jgi:hypothetical protein
LGRLRDGKPLEFDAVAKRLLHSASTSAEMWRFLSLYFIRTEQFHAAAIAADRHLECSPWDVEAFLRRFRIALLAFDAKKSMRLLAEHRERCTSFQYECSRFQYLGRFNQGHLSIERDAERLRELASFEFGRALLKEVSLDSTVDVGEGLSKAQPNFREFARTIACIDKAPDVVLVGNGGSLRGSALGADIDRSNLVVRINFPRLQEFTDDVGSRTDLVFFTEAFLRTKENARSLKYLRAEYPQVPGIAVDASRRDHFDDVLYIERSDPGACLMPVEIRTLLRALSYEFATTGVCAAVLLSWLFRKKLVLFGFDFFSPTTAIHFFSDEKPDIFIGHETAFERFLLASLSFGNRGS